MNRKIIAFLLNAIAETAGQHIGALRMGMGMNCTDGARLKGDFLISCHMAFHDVQPPLIEIDNLWGVSGAVAAGELGNALGLAFPGPLQ